MSSISDNTIAPIDQRLRQLATDSPDLRQAVRLYETMLPLLQDAELSVAPVPINPVQALEKLGAGVPLLADLDLKLDLQALSNLMLKLAKALAGNECGVSVPRRVSLMVIRLLLEEGSAFGEKILAEVFCGNRDAVREIAQYHHLDPDQLLTLAEQALKPALHAWRRQVHPLTEGIHWDQGTCPVCGALATLGELLGNSEELHLRCGQCGAGWPFQRLRCARCGIDDHTTLRCFFPEQTQNRLRLELCDHCHGYMKIITTFDPTPPELLPVEDLATLHLDVIARDQGYELPSRG